MTQAERRLGTKEERKGRNETDSSCLAYSRGKTHKYAGLTKHWKIDTFLFLASRAWKLTLVDTVHTVAQGGKFMFVLFETNLDKLRQIWDKAYCHIRHPEREAHSAQGEKKAKSMLLFWLSISKLSLRTSRRKFFYFFYFAIGYASCLTQNNRCNQISPKWIETISLANIVELVQLTYMSTLLCDAQLHFVWWVSSSLFQHAEPVLVTNKTNQIRTETKGSVWEMEAPLSMQEKADRCNQINWKCVPYGNILNHMII
jgi:hypothetical protein